MGSRSHERRFLPVPINPDVPPQMVMGSKGKEFRFGPGRIGKPATTLWKFWVHGNEAYAMVRNSGGPMKISVHASGQIHMRREGRDLQQLAPPTVMGGGSWLHAFELRFLLSDDTPCPPSIPLKGKAATLVEVPSGAMLVANLLVVNGPASAALPSELTGGQVMWSAGLRNGRSVALVARVLRMDAQNREAIRLMRSDAGLKVTFSAAPKTPPHIEGIQLHWSQDGANVILVIPVGKEAVRFEEDPAAVLARASDTDRRTLRINTAPSELALLAPNGAMIGTLSLATEPTNLQVIKGIASLCPLGLVTLKLAPNELIAGARFQRPGVELKSALSVDGVSPPTWDYTVYSSFDGDKVVAEIRSMSVALRNANVSATTADASAAEEVVVVAPVKGLALSASITSPITSTPLTANVTLRGASGSRKQNER